MTTKEKRQWNATERFIKREIARKQFEDYCEEYIDFQCCAQSW